MACNETIRNSLIILGRILQKMIKHIIKIIMLIPSLSLTLLPYASMCMCVYVRDREKDKETQRERFNIE